MCISEVKFNLSIKKQNASLFKIVQNVFTYQLNFIFYKRIIVINIKYVAT